MIFSYRELGKVTNWFRNLRQTARKKERRALEAEGIHPSTKRGRSDALARTRQQKRSRLAFDDDDDDAAASVSHVHSGTFETGSTGGSVDMDYADCDRPDAYFVRHRGEPLARSRVAYVERPSFGEYDHHPRFERPSYDRPSGYLDARRHDGVTQGHEHERDHEHDHESRSELGTESDAAHEAVTPEPQGVAETIPSASIPASTQHSGSNPAKHPSVDDAMLLLAFHGAGT